MEGRMKANEPEPGAATVSPESGSPVTMVTIKENGFRDGPGEAGMGAAPSSHQGTHEDLALSSEETDNAPEKESNKENDYSKDLPLVDYCLLVFMVIFLIFLWRRANSPSASNKNTG
jgi:hypothetical protein